MSGGATCRRNTRDLKHPFQTPSARRTTADVVCLVGALAKSIWNIKCLFDEFDDLNLTKEERNKRVISELCNIGTYIGHLGVAGIGIADMAYSGYVAAEKLILTGEALTNLENAAQQTGQHLSIATGVVGTVVGVYVTARNTRKSISAGIRMSKVQKLLKEADYKLDPAVDHEKAMLEHLTFAEKKLRRKKFKTAFTATSALIGTAGSIGGLAVAAVGTMAVRTPGTRRLDLFAVGLGVGLGVTAYVVCAPFQPQASLPASRRDQETSQRQDLCDAPGRGLPGPRVQAEPERFLGIRPAPAQ